MPVAACQLVLLTAAEGQTLVGSASFAASLPLAASGEYLEASTSHLRHVDHGSGTDLVYASPGCSV